jgi:hypothetical protein
MKFESNFASKNQGHNYGRWAQGKRRPFIKHARLHAYENSYEKLVPRLKLNSIFQIYTYVPSAVWKSKCGLLLMMQSWKEI